MSPSIHHIGGIVWPVFWSNVFCWIIVYFCICNGVKSVGKVSMNIKIFSELIFLGTLSITSYNICIPRILYTFLDSVFHRFISVRGVMCPVYKRRDLTGGLERDTVLHSTWLEPIDETKSKCHRFVLIVYGLLMYNHLISCSSINTVFY